MGLSLSYFELVVYLFFVGLLVFGVRKLKNILYTPEQLKEYPHVNKAEGCFWVIVLMVVSLTTIDIGDKEAVHYRKSFDKEIGTVPEKKTTVEPNRESVYTEFSSKLSKEEIQ